MIEITKLRCKSILTALGLILAASWAVAQSSGHDGDTVVLQSGGGEFFIGGLPSGWRQIAGNDNDIVHHRQWIPIDQGTTDYRDSIVYQSLPRYAGIPAKEFLSGLASDYTQRCPQLLATEVKGSDNANGFDDALLILACTRNSTTDQGEVTLFRAVAGEKSFYVVQRAWLLPPFTPEAIPISGPQFDEASKVINYGHACQLGSQTRPCPAGWDGVLGGLDKNTPAVIFPASQ